MRSKTLRFGEGFRVAFEARAVEAAEMVLAPGTSEGGADNDHRGADQWLFVVSGTGMAVVDGERIALKTGTLLLIERQEKHEVCNTGRGLLKTLNFYSPPTFGKDGEAVGPGRTSDD